MSTVKELADGFCLEIKDLLDLKEVFYFFDNESESRLGGFYGFGIFIEEESAGVRYSAEFRFGFSQMSMHLSRINELTGYGEVPVETINVDYVDPKFSVEYILDYIFNGQK